MNGRVNAFTICETPVLFVELYCTRTPPSCHLNEDVLWAIVNSISVWKTHPMFISILSFVVPSVCERTNEQAAPFFRVTYFSPHFRSTRDIFRTRNRETVRARKLSSKGCVFCLASISGFAFSLFRGIGFAFHSFGKRVGNKQNMLGLHAVKGAQNCKTTREKN